MTCKFMRNLVILIVLTLISPTVVGQPAQSHQSAHEAHRNSQNKFLGRRLENSDLDKAKTAVDRLKDLADNLKTFDPIKGFAAIQAFAKVAPLLGSLGAVIGLVNVFLPSDSETDVVMEGLVLLQQQMDAFQTETQSWFKHISQRMSASECKVMYHSAVQTLMQGHAALQRYRDSPSEQNRMNFMQSCESELVCDKSVSSLINALSGSTMMGCDLMRLAFQGTEESDYFKGSLSATQVYIGSLMLMISQGIAVEAAFESMRDNSTASGDAVSSRYQARVEKVTTRWNEKLKECYDGVKEHATESATQWIKRNIGMPRADFADQLAVLLRRNYGSHLFTVVTMTENWWNRREHSNAESQDAFIHINYQGLDVEIVLLERKPHLQPSNTIKGLKQQCEIENSGILHGLQKNPLCFSTAEKYASDSVLSEGLAYITTWSIGQLGPDDIVLDRASTGPEESYYMSQHVMYAWVTPCTPGGPTPWNPDGVLCPRGLENLAWLLIAIG